MPIKVSIGVNICFILLLMAPGLWPVLFLMGIYSIDGHGLCVLHVLNVIFLLSMPMIENIAGNDFLLFILNGILCWLIIYNGY